MKQEKRYKHLYPTAFMLYVTFFVHGFGAAIIGQNVTSPSAAVGDHSGRSCCRDISAWNRTSDYISIFRSIV